jgi:hypothetical protein
MNQPHVAGVLSEIDAAIEEERPFGDVAAATTAAQSAFRSRRSSTPNPACGTGVAEDGRPATSTRARVETRRCGQTSIRRRHTAAVFTIARSGRCPRKDDTDVPATPDVYASFTC